MQILYLLIQSLCKLNTHKKGLRTMIRKEKIHDIIGIRVPGREIKSTRGISEINGPVASDVSRIALKYLPMIISILSAVCIREIRAWGILSRTRYPRRDVTSIYWLRSLITPETTGSSLFISTSTLWMMSWRILSECRWTNIGEVGRAINTIDVISPDRPTPDWKIHGFVKSYLPRRFSMNF